MDRWDSQSAPWYTQVELGGSGPVNSFPDFSVSFLHEEASHIQQRKYHYEICGQIHTYVEKYYVGKS